MKELYEKRARLVQEAKAILDEARKEDRTLTSEEQERFDALTAEIEALGATLERHQRAQALEHLMEQRQGRKAEDSPANIGMSDKDARSYSLLRAIRAAATGDWRGAELEREASDAVAKRMGRDPQSFFVPYDVLARSVTGREERVAKSGAGANMIATDHLAGSFIDLLRNRLVTTAAGARILTDLVGDVDIPKLAAGSTAYWVAEGSDVTESDVTPGKVSMTPKTVGAVVPITRKMLLQSSPEIEAIVRDDMARTLALAIDYQALHGDGTGATPTGIAATTGVAVVAIGANGGAPTWSHIVQLETEVAIDNADLGALAYVTNPQVRGKLKETEKASGTAQFVWGMDNTLNGYRTLVSNQVRSDLTKGTGSNLSAIFFGNWNDLLIGQWGTLDILVDPYALAKSGGIRVVALQDVDIAVRHPESFAVILDADTA